MDYRTKRKALGLTLEDIASMSGCTKQNVYKFENGKLETYVDTGMNISDELLIDVLGKNNDVVMKNPTSETKEGVKVE